MAKVKCSYILGNFNKQAYIAESLQSMINSTEKDIEIIVVDDCSTDYSMDILEHYAKTDSRVKLFRNDKNEGVAYTYNKATSHVTSPIVLVSASDDVYDYDRAKWAIKAFKKFEADIIYWPFYKAQERLVSGKGVCLVPFEKKLSPKFDGELLKKVEGQFIGHGFSAYTKKVADTVRYRDEIKHGCDHHFFLDCMKSGFRFQNIEDDKQLAGTYRFYIDMVSHKFRPEILENDTKLEREFA